MQAVTVSNSGECNPIVIKKMRGGGFSYQKKRLHVHFEETSHGLIVMSTHEPRLLHCESTPLFTFLLPPPLNAYVYSTPLFVLRVDAQGEVTDLTPTEFVQLCKRLDAQASVKEETVAVYDVPAVPFDSVIDDVDYPSEEEEEEESDQDEDIEEDIEEDDWDLEDEDAGTAIVE